jgi:hypothetical protein
MRKSVVLVREREISVILVKKLRECLCEKECVCKRDR